MIKIKYLFSVVILFQILTYCTYDHGEEVEIIVVDPVSLVDDVMPIINVNCAISGCHLDTRSPLMSSRERVIAASGRIKIQLEAGNMPPTGELPPNDVEVILKWIGEGAKDN
jgi:hypothetical protein